jgi:hypothetical protein
MVALPPRDERAGQPPAAARPGCVCPPAQFLSQTGRPHQACPQGPALCFRPGLVGRATWNMPRKATYPLPARSIFSPGEARHQVPKGHMARAEPADGRGHIKRAVRPSTPVPRPFFQP